MGSSEDALARTRASAVSVVSQQQWQSWASMTDLQSAAVRVLENTLRTTTTGTHAPMLNGRGVRVCRCVVLERSTQKDNVVSFQTCYYLDLGPFIFRGFLAPIT